MVIIIIIILVELLCWVATYHKVLTFEKGHGVVVGRPSSLALHSSQQYIEYEKGQIRNRLSELKTIDLKNILQRNGISTNGLFDKSDYISTILVREQQLVSQCHYEKLSKFINYQNDRFYCGIECMVGNKKLSFMLDTGSSVSLIRKDTAIDKLSLSPQRQVLYTDSFGQSSQQQSAAAPLSNSKVTVSSMMFMDQRLSIDMVVLDNPASLPLPCDGLLGLNFFQSLNSDVLMDFQGSFMKCGPSQSLLPLALTNEFELLRCKKVPTGLRVVTSFIPVPTCSMLDKNGLSSVEASSSIMSGLKPISCDAMLDVGSLYTIANSAAARELLASKYPGSTGYGLADLPTTTTICAGIDGKPLPLRLMRTPYIQMGSNRINVSVINEGTGIFAADVAGLSNLGLNQGPSLIVGLDVLASTQLVLRRDGDIMMRLNVQ